MLETRNGVPYSSTYHDIYFSTDHGLDETRHVFIEGNRLNQQWAGQQQFVIGETGFGTGLNFLATWEHWKNSADRCDVLHYVSVEKHPLNRQQLAQCLAHFDDLQPLSDQLIASYPLLTPGFHRLWFEQNCICLTLCLLDVEQALDELDGIVDSWYLDGFSPANNPQMWTDTVFRHIARLSRQDTSLATFTAAGKVRRGLEQAGFEMTRIPGYGRKREMLAGILRHLPQIRQLKPWKIRRSATRRSATRRSASTAPQSVMIVGAGIAGAQVARNLADHGIAVEVLDQGSVAGTGASGGPRGIISPRLTAKPSPEESLSIAGFLYAVRQLNRIASGDCWSQCGVLHLATTDRKRQQWQAIRQRALPVGLVQAINAEQAGDIAGVPVDYPALYFRDGGWIDPRVVIRILLDHPLITTRYRSTVDRIEQQKHGWVVALADGGILHTESLVLANGYQLASLMPVEIPLDPVAGQTTLMTTTAASGRLRTVIQHEGYVTPAYNGQHLLGASHLRGENSIKANRAADHQNQATLAQYVPSLTDNSPTLDSAHTGIRLATRTRLPLAGRAPDVSYFRQYHRSGGSANEPNPSSLPGLCICGALGARGLTSAALMAEVLVSSLCGAPAPVEKSLQQMVDPIEWLAKHPQEPVTG